MLRSAFFLKTNKKLINILITLIIVIKIVIFDQLTKQAVLEYFASDNDIIHPLPFLNITKVYNKGVSFGFLGDMPNGNIILSVVAVSIIIALWVWFYRNITVYNSLAIGLITGGAVGNLIDRALHKAVIDFIDFHYQNWHYPAFNIADSAIVIGVIILALRTLTANQ